MDRSRLGPPTFLIAALVAAAVFTRLGVWQVERLEDRRERNLSMWERAHLPELDLAQVPDDVEADSLAWRRVVVRGVYDYGNEVVIRGRSRDGSPGVHVVTPLRIESGTSVLVLRGWLPASDGVSAELGTGRPPAGSGPEGQPREVTGVALPAEGPSPVEPRRREFDVGEQVVLGSIAVDQASEALGLSLLPVFVLPVPGTRAEAEAASGRPWPVDAPTPSDGPHLMYAVQWFGFALITLAGTVVYLSSRRQIPSARKTST